MDSERVLCIREQNDTFRTTFVGGRVVMTRSVAALREAQCCAITEAVRTYDTFNGDNDPYGQHDFGALTLDGERVYWKIDYYDADCVYGSEDPSDPKKTTRVLTIMLAEDY